MITPSTGYKSQAVSPAVTKKTEALPENGVGLEKQLQTHSHRSVPLMNHEPQRTHPKNVALHFGNFARGLFGELRRYLNDVLRSETVQGIDFIGTLFLEIVTGEGRESAVIEILTNKKLLHLSSFSKSPSLNGLTGAQLDRKIRSLEGCCKRMERILGHTRHIGARKYYMKMLCVASSLVDEARKKLCSFLVPQNESPGNNSENPQLPEIQARTQGGSQARDHASGEQPSDSPLIRQQENQDQS